jgi:SNF2 family DNA or RNA helicase
MLLDEAQTIKNRNTLTAKACFYLQAQKRLCLTGTPLQNSVDDIYSLFCFLKVSNWGEYSYFSRNISEPLKNGRFKIATERLQVILKAIMLRRTKLTLINNKPLISLPSKVIEIEELSLEEDERQFYDALEQKSQKLIKKYYKVRHRKKKNLDILLVLNQIFQLYIQADKKLSYSNMLTLILRLRQACDHPYLVSFDPASVQESIKEEVTDPDDLAIVMSSLTMDTNYCKICGERLSESVKSTCTDCSTLDRLPCSNTTPAQKRALMLADMRKNWVSSTKMDKVSCGFLKSPFSF